MVQVRDGDVGSLGTLFERHHAPLFRFFLRLTGDRTASEDLVQEVFFRMLKYRHAYRDSSVFTAWMYQIARHVRFDRLSRARPEVPLDADEHEKASDLPLPGEAAERREESDLVRRALDRLPPEKREVLVLSRFQKLPYDEIAEILGCEVGAVKVRVYRAVRELRDAFFELQGKRAS
jgi:RNA polymerase sigma-70 factor (ECF subfamily)